MADRMLHRQGRTLCRCGRRLGLRDCGGSPFPPCTPVWCLGNSCPGGWGSSGPGLAVIGPKLDVAGTASIQTVNSAGFGGVNWLANFTNPGGQALSVTPAIACDSGTTNISHIAAASPAQWTPFPGFTPVPNGVVQNLRVLSRWRLVPGPASGPTVGPSSGVQSASAEPRFECTITGQMLGGLTGSPGFRVFCFVGRLTGNVYAWGDCFSTTYPVPPNIHSGSISIVRTAPFSSCAKGWSFNVSWSFGIGGTNVASGGSLDVTQTWPVCTGTESGGCAGCRDGGL